MKETFLDKVGRASMHSFDYKKATDYVTALRKNFPAEWQVVHFYEFKPMKDSMEFTTYIVVDGVELRSDFELSTEAFVEMNWDGVFETIRILIDSDIEAGIVEEVRARQND